MVARSRSLLGGRSSFSISTQSRWDGVRGTSEPLGSEFRSHCQSHLCHGSAKSQYAPCGAVFESFPIAMPRDSRSSACPLLRRIPIPIPCDRLAIATTSRGAVHRCIISGIGPAIGYPLEIVSASSSDDPGPSYPPHSTHSSRSSSTALPSGRGVHGAATLAIDGSYSTAWSPLASGSSGGSGGSRGGGGDRWFLLRLPNRSVLTSLYLWWAQEALGQSDGWRLFARNASESDGCSPPTPSLLPSLNWTTAVVVAGGVGGVQMIQIPNGSASGAVGVRIWGAIPATSYGISLWEVALFNEEGDRLDLAAPPEASYEQGDHVASNAVDNDLTTRWASSGSSLPRDWLVLRWNANQTLAAVRITWEAAYATEVRIDMGHEVSMAPGCEWATMGGAQEGGSSCASLFGPSSADTELHGEEIGMTAMQTPSEGCCAVCASDLACRGFVDYGGHCYFKGGELTKSFAAGRVAYIRLPQQVPQQYRLSHMTATELLLLSPAWGVASPARLALAEIAVWGREEGAPVPNSVRISPPATAVHLGGMSLVGGQLFAMSAEVSHLSRSVVITSADPDAFLATGLGLHTLLVLGGRMQVRYTRVEQCGRQGELGRYCLHLHHVSHCPDCSFEGNAVVDGVQKGITVHDTHDVVVRGNVLVGVKGVGIYTEDGNESNNTFEANVALCSLTADGASQCTADGHPSAGIYLVGMANHFIGNRVSGYENGMWTGGSHHPHGQGASWGQVCPAFTSFASFIGNVNHDNGRFGLYLDGQSPRRLRLNGDGRLIAGPDGELFASCAEFDADGNDNGVSPAVVVTASMEWHNLFVGQYHLGDIRFDRLASINNLHGMYWKTSKDLAERAAAHVSDSIFANGGSDSVRFGQLQFFGPAGPFTFVLRNVTFLGGPVGLAALAAGQHCGLAAHNGGVPGSLCNVQYLLQSVDFSRLDPIARRVAFGASGGNPIVPTFSSRDGSLGGVRSLVSPFLNGFAAIPGCNVTAPHGPWGGAIACAHRVRRLSIWTDDQGNLTLAGPGYDVPPHDVPPVLSANAGILH